jgi:transcriptional regulator CtsR
VSGHDKGDHFDLVLSILNGVLLQVTIFTKRPQSLRGGGGVIKIIYNGGYSNFLLDKRDGDL